MPANLHAKHCNVESPIYIVSVDSWLSWIIALLCCVGLVVSTSFFFVNGIFYVYIIDEFNLDLVSLTLIGSVHFTVVLAGAFFTVRLVERFSLRPVVMVAGILQFSGCFIASFVSSYVLLFFSLAIIFGFGSSLAYVNFFMVGNKYFKKHSALALTFISMGGALSAMGSPSLIQYLLSQYGFQGAMRIYSALLLHTCVAGASLLPVGFSDKKKNDVTQKTTQANDKFHISLVFVAFTIVNMLFSAGNSIPQALLPETAETRGVRSSDISLAFSIGGGFQLAGRLLFGCMTYKYDVYAKQIWSFYLLGYAFSMLIIPFASVFGHFLAFTLTNGFFRGSGNLAPNLVLKNIVPRHHFGRAISFGLMFQGIGTLVGTPLAAYLQEVTGNGNAPYMLSFGLFCVAGLLLLPFRNTSEAHNSQYELID